MSVLSWGEVLYNVWQHYGARSGIAELSRLPIEIVPVEEIKH